MRRFELSEGTSNKFWEVAQEASSVTVRFGRIGTNGQTQTKSFPDEKKAAAELAKLVAEKTKKGYAEVGAAPAGAPDKAAEGAAPKAASPKKVKAAAEPEGLPEGFVAADKGYALGIKDGKLVARNPKGQLLGTVPKELKESELGEQLAALVEWLEAHERGCVEWAENWMLRSLPLPAAVIEETWKDLAYRRALENLVVFAIDDKGVIDEARGGLLRGADATKGVGVVDRDGETTWLKVDRIAVPHPIVMSALDDWRALATEIAATQGTKQLFREVFSAPADLAAGARMITKFEGGKFKQLNHALGTSKTLGYRVSGGSATCRVLEGGRTIEARYWLGDDDPSSETVTGSLLWVDEKQTQLEVSAVPPIALSEGMRMASAIFAKRVIEEEKEA